MRSLPTYTPEAIRAAINEARTHTNWRDRAAVCDLAGAILAGPQADDDTIAVARAQVEREMG